MVDCNINQEWAYRTKNGEPVPEVPGGPGANKYRNLAIAHDAMLSDFVESIINWVLAARQQLTVNKDDFTLRMVWLLTSGSDQR